MEDLSDIPESPPPAAAKAPSTAEARDAALADLMAWHAQHIPNSPFSRDTRAYNRIHAAMSEIGSAIASVRE